MKRTLLILSSLVAVSGFTSKLLKLPCKHHISCIAHMASVEQNPGDKTKRSDFQSSTLYRISEDPSDDFELPWTEFEDWLVQDTYGRYVIGAGQHVLWRSMVSEVPELMGRTPDEVRSRWLHVTGRHQKSKISDIPDVDNFYQQPPLLEQWEELDNGSFEGSIFGLNGVADGVIIKTSAVSPTGRRITENYIRTEGDAVFELGVRRNGPEKNSLVPILEAFVSSGPLLALTSLAAIVGATMLTHHIQLEVFVV